MAWKVLSSLILGPVKRATMSTEGPKVEFIGGMPGGLSGGECDGVYASGLGNLSGKTLRVTVEEEVFECCEKWRKFLPGECSWCPKCGRRL